MALAIAIIGVAAALTPDAMTPPTTPEESQSACWVEPLKLTLPEVLAMGHV